MNRERLIIASLVAMGVGIYLVIWFFLMIAAGCTSADPCI